MGKFSVLSAMYFVESNCDLCCCQNGAGAPGATDSGKKEAQEWISNWRESGGSQKGFFD